MLKDIPRFLCAWLLLPLLASCVNGTNEDPIEQVTEKQVQIIQDFLDSRGVTYDKLESGIFVYRKSPGNGTPVLEEDVVDATFSLSVFEGSLVYEQEPIIFIPNVAALFPGMAKGVQALEVEEEAKLFLPSVEGYAATSPTVNGVRIPSNAILVMDLKVNNKYTEPEYNQLEIDSILSRVATEGFSDIAELINVNDTTFVKVQTKAPDDPASNLPENGDFVTVNYKLSSLDGAETVDSGESFGFQVASDNVIYGFSEAVKTMREGEKAIFFLTSRAGYGAVGSGLKVKPFTILRFDIELVIVPDPD